MLPVHMRTGRGEIWIDRPIIIVISERSQHFHTLVLLSYQRLLVFENIAMTVDDPQKKGGADDEVQNIQ